jgi:hypothetical protein
VLQKHFDFITDDIVAAAVLLAGGGDRATTGSCGAFSGGLMALSAKFSPRSGEPSEQEMAQFNQNRVAIHEFRDWFIAEFGGVPCADVQHRQLGRVYNLMDPGELKAFGTTPGIREKCTEVYAKAAIKIAEMLCREDIRSQKAGS